MTNRRVKCPPIVPALGGGGGGGGSAGGAVGGAAASAQNPVLSKLLMADQDGPLDLTVKKSPELDLEPSQQGED